MRELILEILERKRKEKRDAKVVPDHTMFNELQKEVEAKMRSELNRLFQDGIISVGNTINSKYIKLNDGK